MSRQGTFTPAGLAIMEIFSPSDLTMTMFTSTNKTASHVKQVSITIRLIAFVHNA